MTSGELFAHAVSSWITALFWVWVGHAYGRLGGSLTVLAYSVAMIVLAYVTRPDGTKPLVAWLLSLTT